MTPSPPWFMYFERLVLTVHMDSSELLNKRIQAAEEPRAATNVHIITEMGAAIKP